MMMAERPDRAVNQRVAVWEIQGGPLCSLTLVYHNSHLTLLFGPPLSLIEICI